ncbi:MAG: TraB/GumN family protein [Pseudomonadales bacterium]|jgi:uncharacterized protein YbaP (TraB family)|nr:TraB/GumN family protein [Pseudomonadales bacterium]
MKTRTLISRTLTVFFAAALPLAALAQTPSPAPQPPTPLLWKISDADNAVYLLGSFHLLKPNDYPPSKDVEDAFADAESLMFEVSPEEMTAPDLAARAQQAAMIAEGKTLADVLPQATLTKLQQIMQISGTPMEQVEHLDPWALEAGMVTGMAQATGFRQELGLDAYFMQRAQRAGKPATGLETLDVQLATLDGTPYPEQAYSLGKILDNPQQAILDLNDLHTAWRTGDVAKMDSEMRADMAEKTPESYRLMNIVRNDAWLPQIMQRLDEAKSGNTLIVVGALHLLGSDGLVEKLRAKGYKVERICSACTAQ